MSYQILLLVKRVNYLIFILCLTSCLIYSENKTKDDSLKLSLNPSLSIANKDQFSLKLIGFMQLDSVLHIDDVVDHPNGTSIRRARVGFAGDVKKVFSYKFLYDFGNDNPELQDALV